MTDNLLPCPFCGGKPEFRRSGQRGHYIACTGCDSASTMFTAVKEDVRHLLIETWNRRAQSPESTQTRKRQIMEKEYDVTDMNLAYAEREIYELRKFILLLKEHAEFEDEVLDMIDEVIERRADFYVDICPA